MRRGYQVILNAPVNRTSLVIRQRKAAREATAIGFRVLDRGRSYKQVPDGFPRRRRGQSFMTLLKQGGGGLR
jgi:hypothetical protein